MTISKNDVSPCYWHVVQKGVCPTPKPTPEAVLLITTKGLYTSDTIQSVFNTWASLFFLPLLLNVQREEVCMDGVGSATPPPQLYSTLLTFSPFLLLAGSPFVCREKTPASISSRSVKELMPIVIDLWVPRTYQLFNTWKRWLLCLKYIYSIICLMAFPFFQVFLFLMDSLTSLPFGCKWAPYRISRISAMNNVSPSF